MGWSEGGQYALAAAFALGERVTRCGVIAGCLPLDDPITLKETNHLDRSLIRLSKHAPFAVRTYFVLTRVLARHAPKVVVRTGVRNLPAGESKAVTERGQWLPTLLAEGATNSRGGVDEYLAMSAPWGFRPEDVTVPVRIFQGAADALVPEAWGRSLAAVSPGRPSPAIPTRGTSSASPDGGKCSSISLRTSGRSRREIDGEGFHAVIGAHVAVICRVESTHSWVHASASMVTRTLPHSLDPSSMPTASPNRARGNRWVMSPAGRAGPADRWRPEPGRVLHRPADGELLHQHHQVVGRDRLVVEGDHRQPTPHRAVVEDIGDDLGRPRSLDEGRRGRGRPEHDGLGPVETPELLPDVGRRRVQRPPGLRARGRDRAGWD